MHPSVSEIRTRLLTLLVRAFVFVLLLTVIFFLFVVGYFVTAQLSPITMPFIGEFQGYYIGHGNWDGIDASFDAVADDQLKSLLILLVDENQRIVLDRDADPATTIGSRYELNPNDFAFPLEADDKRVGTLVILSVSPWSRLGIARAVIFPVGLISFLLSIFLVIVATLLVRRFVNPLANVIYAAREVADGKFNTRISSKGPQDMRSLSDSFNEMASSLERNDRERRDMLADIAHELRTPLSVIRGRLEGIVDGIYPENGPQVSMALEQTYILQRLVDDLRLLTLAETRQLPFDKRDINVENVVNSVIEMFSAEAQEKNIALSFSEKNGNLSAFVDPQRFEQVISNLVGNAIRYVPEGGKVWVTANEIAHGLRIIVNDNGEGIPAEDLPFIFDRFWRKEKSRARLSGGTGLGLAITRQLVEAQGGTIEARNLEEGGLQVVVELNK